MDLICEYEKLNKCVDFEDREIQDISEAVDILMKRFVERMQWEYPDVKIKELRLCDSMAEKTRLRNETHFGEQLEFDYLAVLETWTGFGKQRFKESEQHPEYNIVEVKDTCSFKSENILLSNGVGKIFISQFVDTVQAECKRNFCQRMGLSYNIIDVSFGCRFCTVSMESGYLTFNRHPDRILGFVWLPKRLYDQAHTFISRNHTEHNHAAFFCTPIDVDFHPLFVDNTNNENVEDCVVPNIALFPKGCSNCRNDVCRLFLWQKSTQEQETKLINKTSAEHKLAFMSLKHMFANKPDKRPDKCQIITTSPVFSQYMLKNIFLLHIRKCSKKQTAGCLVNMIDLMSRCCIRLKLPHLLFKFNLLNYTDHTLYTIKAFGYCLQAISTLSSITNVHRELQDIATDVFTISFIALASETEACLSKCKSREGFKEQLKITKTVMKKFIHLRHEHSAAKTQNYFIEKYRLLMEYYNRRRFYQFQEVQERQSLNVSM